MRNAKGKDIVASDLVGGKILIHGGKIQATVHDAPDNDTVRIDYDGYLDPKNKKFRVFGRKVIGVEELLTPEKIRVGIYQEELLNKLKRIENAPTSKKVKKETPNE